MNFRSTQVALAAIFMLFLAACEAPEQTEPVVTPAESTPAETTDTVAEEAESVTELDVTETVEETEGLEEEAAEEEEIELTEAATTPESEGDSKTWKYKEGEHYRRLTASQGTSSAPDKIEVAEVFWYGCPHCFNFDPLLESWEKDLPPDVAFVRIPVVWNPTNQVHARVMYTAEALGKFDEMHIAIFEGIHQKNESYATEESIIELFEEFDVDEEEFREVYSSFGVTSAVKRAENLTRRYGIRSVPVLVINGKYVTDAPEVKSFGDMLNIADELVERERAGL